MKLKPVVLGLVFLAVISAGIVAFFLLDRSPEEDVVAVFESNLKGAFAEQMEISGGVVSADSFRSVEFFEFNNLNFELADGTTDEGKFFYKFHSDIKEPGLDCTKYSGETALMCMFVKYNYGYDTVRVNTSGMYESESEKLAAVNFVLELPKSTYQEIALSESALRFLLGGARYEDPLYETGIVELCRQFSEKYARDGAEGLCGTYFAGNLMQRCYQDYSLFSRVSSFYPSDFEDLFCYYSAYMYFKRANQEGEVTDIVSWWKENNPRGLANDAP